MNNFFLGGNKFTLLWNLPFTADVLQAMLKRMSSITFDTLKFAQRLEKAGATREYAVAEAEALADVLSSGSQDLATKGDLREMRTEINGELKLIRWMVGLSLALSTGIIALLAKLFFTLPH